MYGSLVNRGLGGGGGDSDCGGDGGSVYIHRVVMK